MDTWKGQGLAAPELSRIQQEYINSWELYSGQLFHDLQDRTDGRGDPRVYDHTRLLWKHAEAVGDFYAGVVYSGALSTDGDALPEGVPSAIPVDPQAGTEARNGLLLDALSALWSGWNWQQYMSLRPLYGAVLGDVLTELVDDTERRFVYPAHIWPGYVTAIELDHVGNVRAYTLEYPVDEKQPDGTVDHYRYRKEVDGEVFRHYRDDKLTREDRNPYGFVPAIWDRHRLGAPGSVRGRSAIEGTKQALWELNSIFSHAFDHQRKAFILPPLVSTGAPAPSTRQTIDTDADPEAQDYIRIPADAKLWQTQIDIGKTLDMLTALREGILHENPEASFYQQMREMQQVTAPGAERLMGDVKNRVDMARAGYDAQSVKLFQMAIAIAGMRVTGRDWTRAGARLNGRQRVFANFDLGSYGRGELDMTILPRPIVLPTEAERIETERMKAETVRSVESIGTEWGLERFGITDETERKALMNEREAQRESVERFLDAGRLGVTPGGE